MRIPRPPRLSALTAGILCTLVTLAACSTTSTRAAARSDSDTDPAGGPSVQSASAERAGEYLTIVGGCNDCHTQGWAESGGKIAAEDRLAGMNVGFRGAWGTSYGKNLRAIVQRMSEDRWVEILTTADGGEGKPPMPWWNTAAMSERDLRAIYRYIRSLGMKANAVPRSLPPGREPAGAYIWLTPQPAR